MSYFGDFVDDLPSSPSRPDRKEYAYREKLGAGNEWFEDELEARARERIWREFEEASLGYGETTCDQENQPLAPDGIDYSFTPYSATVDALQRGHESDAANLAPAFETPLQDDSDEHQASALGQDPLPTSASFPALPVFAESDFPFLPQPAEEDVTLHRPSEADDSQAVGLPTVPEAEPQLEVPRLVSPPVVNGARIIPTRRARGRVLSGPIAQPVDGPSHPPAIAQEVQRPATFAKPDSTISRVPSLRGAALASSNPPVERHGDTVQNRMTTNAVENSTTTQSNTWIFPPYVPPSLPTEHDNATSNLCSPPAQEGTNAYFAGASAAAPAINLAPAPPRKATKSRKASGKQVSRSKKAKPAPKTSGGEPSETQATPIPQAQFVQAAGNGAPPLLPNIQCGWAGCTEGSDSIQTLKDHVCNHCIPVDANGTLGEAPAQSDKIICGFVGCGKKMRFDDLRKHHVRAHFFGKNVNTCPRCGEYLRYTDARTKHECDPSKKRRGGNPKKDEDGPRPSKRARKN